MGFVDRLRVVRFVAFEILCLSISRTTTMFERSPTRLAPAKLLTAVFEDWQDAKRTGKKAAAAVMRNLLIRTGPSLLAPAASALPCEHNSHSLLTF